MSNDNGLPRGWTLKRLGDICSVMDRDHRTPNYVDAGVPLISPRDFDECGIDFTCLKTVHPDEYVAFVKKCNPEIGDILFSRLGTIGKVRLLDFNFDFVALHSIALVKPTANYLESKYVLYLLQTPDVQSQAKAGVKSIGTPDLGLKRIKDFVVPIAPHKDQLRIVAKIEELFSDLDAGVAALERAKANLKRYRATVLKAAVEGKLTERWRKDNPCTEPASELLQRILTERRCKWEDDQLAKYKAKGQIPPKNWKSKYKEPVEPDTTSLSELPDAWCWATVDQVSDVQGGIQKQPKRRPAKYAFPYLRVANVHRDRLDLSEVHTIELFDGELERLRLKGGDLLIVEGNGSKTEIGRSAIWDGSIPDCVHQNHIIRVRFAVDCPQYLNAYWNSPNGNVRIMNMAASTSGLYTLSVAKVRSLPLPLPPRDEQRGIVAALDETLTQIDAAEIAIDHGLRRGQRLRQSILKRAFEGNLTPHARQMNR